MAVLQTTPGASSTTPAASPSPTATSSQPTPGMMQPAETSGVYLYTFLATLLVLVAVSIAVVTRSYLVRRRLALALASGNLPYNGSVSRGSRSRPIGPAPKIWDVWVADDGEETKEITHRNWETFLPLSVELGLPPSRRQPRVRSTSLSFINQLAHAQTIDREAPQVTFEDQLQDIPVPVRVTMLISMPIAPSRPTLLERRSSATLVGEASSSRWDVESVPPVVFGIADLKVKVNA